MKPAGIERDKQIAEMRGEGIWASKAHCPQCDTELEVIRQSSSSPLNSDQWDAVKAGDYCCHKCPPNKETNSGKFYYLWTWEVTKRPFALKPYSTDISCAFELWEEMKGAALSVELSYEAF